VKRKARHRDARSRYEIHRGFRSDPESKRYSDKRTSCRFSEFELQRERVIQNLKYKCLFKFILFGQRHLDYIVSEWVSYYNTRRAHMERDHLPPIREAPEELLKLDRDQIVVLSYVGGLVKSFERTTDC